jgi:aryl-alcohol dehydrogenase-like predicted oxidoreductase
MSVNCIRLPGTSLDVSALCLGGNRFGGELDRDASFALLDAFVAAGGNFVDTAHAYADWLPGVERSCSEKTIGRWRSARDGGGIVVATKIGHPLLDGSRAKRLDRAALREDVASAIDNLGGRPIDLVYLHRDDPERPVADILGALEEMCSEGLIRHYAASNWTAARLEAASVEAVANGWQGLVANQAEWSLARRNAGSAASDLYAMDAGMIAWHRRIGAAAIPYSSQARGFFDKFARGPIDPATARNYDSPENRSRGEMLLAVARAHGLTPTETMLALFKFAPFPVIPVVGGRDAAQIASSFRGISADLDADDVPALLAALGIAPNREVG